MFLNSLMFCFHRLCFILSSQSILSAFHDDVIKWKHFPRNWPFVREIHRSPVNFPHKGQWRGALMFSLIYPWINDWVNNREAGDLRRQHGHYDVIVMYSPYSRAFAIRFSKSLQWCLWRLKSPASRSFAQPFVQAQVREKISRLRGTGLSERNPSDQWIPLKKRPVMRKMPCYRTAAEAPIKFESDTRFCGFETLMDFNPLRPSNYAIIGSYNGLPSFRH